MSNEEKDVKTNTEQKATAAVKEKASVTKKKTSTVKKKTSTVKKKPSVTAAKSDDKKSTTVKKKVTRKKAVSKKTDRVAIVAGLRTPFARQMTHFKDQNTAWSPWWSSPFRWSARSP